MSRGTQDAASSPVHFPLRDCHTLWSCFPAGSRSVRFGNSTYAVLQPPCVNTWVWAFPISLAATLGISVIYFPSGTEMVHFPELAHTSLCIQPAVAGVHPAGFPHSEIPGSKPACGSPRLIAACHVLHRLLAPRHPPYALSSLIIKLTQYVVCRGATIRLRSSLLIAVPRYAGRVQHFGDLTVAGLSGEAPAATLPAGNYYYLNGGGWAGTPGGITLEGAILNRGQRQHHFERRLHLLRPDRARKG